MNLIIESSLDFFIENNKISSKEKFFVIEKGNDLIIQKNTNNINTNNINITGNSFSFNNSRNNVINLNGIEIEIKDKKVILNGDVSKIILNNEDIDLKSHNIKKEVSNENEYNSFNIQNIDLITLKGSGGILIVNDQSFNKKIKLEVFGSGDIKYKNSNNNIDNLDINIKGSGDIVIYNNILKNLNVFIMGSGDVELNNCKIINSNLSIMGSGDITFNKTMTENVNKNIMGSGDIKL
jgi:hypothetical protein